MTRRLLEIESLAAFDSHIRRARSLNGWFVQSLDLTERTEALLSVNPRGGVFLGCRFTPVVEDYLHRAGALLFPRLPDLPFEPYRTGLYTAAELYGAGDYRSSADASIYAWSGSAQARQLPGRLASTLHDYAITDALDGATQHLDPSRVVGVMGGHALQRGAPAYRAAAELGEQLTRSGRTVLTGGGPGAMEAANLGAYLSPWPDVLDEAVTILAAVPDYGSSLDAWTAAAFAVGDRWPTELAGHSLSVPTWFFGHSRRTPSRPRSRSTSPMRSGRTPCCTAAAAGSSTFPAWRNAAGDLPGGHRELLCRGHIGGRAADPGRGGLLDPGLSGLATAAAARRGSPNG